jgi:serine/threonine-protein kinase
MLICPVCGKLNTEGSSNCDLCGAPVATAERRHVPSVAGGAPAQEAVSGPICPVCKRPNRAISAFCAFCGYRLNAAGGPQPYALPNGNTDRPNPGPTSPAIPSNEAGNIPSGTVLKRRYRIMRKIAQGGMGAVYESTDMIAPSGTRWAVKEMSPASLPAPERTQAIADFRKEAQMLAALRHPNLPTVVETFEELGKNFLVMEFVAGHTLQSVLDGTPGFLPEERVRVWARQLFDVMQYLHAQDPPIVYRDLKPANVMLMEATERIKLIDFGIARFHKAGKSRDTEAFGTAGYAPPEQYGKGQTDQRSDVYALAATLHYLVTKHDPGLSPFNWLPVRQYNPALSTQLEGALQVALNLDPQRRFPTVREFATAVGLENPMVYQPAQRPVEASPPRVTGPALAPVPTPAPAPVAPAPQRQSSQGSGRQRGANPKPGVTINAKPKPQASPAAPKPQRPATAVPFAPPRQGPAVVLQPATSPARPAVAAAPVATVNVPTAAPAVQTHRPAPPSVDLRPAGGAPSTDLAGGAPALEVSERLVDLGEARWNSKPVRRLSLVNVGGGEMRGTVQSMQPWVALNVQSFQGNAQTIEVRVRKRLLPFARVELQVPNLFAIIGSRTRRYLPFILLWFWILLLVASSLGRYLFWTLGATAGALVLAQGLMWWWALHVRLLVPAEKLNSGSLLVKSSGGEQKIEVRVKAQPSWVRTALGWIVAGLLMTAELAALLWIALRLVSYYGIAI